MIMTFWNGFCKWVEFYEDYVPTFLSYLCGFLTQLFCFVFAYAIIAGYLLLMGWTAFFIYGTLAATFSWPQFPVLFFTAIFALIFVIRKFYKSYTTKEAK